MALTIEGYSEVFFRSQDFSHYRIASCFLWGTLLCCREVQHTAALLTFYFALQCHASTFKDLLGLGVCATLCSPFLAPDSVAQAHLRREWQEGSETELRACAPM